MSCVQHTNTKWIDERLAQHTSKFKQHCHAGNIARLRTLIFRISWRVKIDLRMNFLHWRSHTFLPKSWVSSKLQSHTVRRNLNFFLSMQVHAWTEFSLLIFGIRFLKCCTFLPSKEFQRKSVVEIAAWHIIKRAESNLQRSEWCNVDYVYSNVKSSLFDAMLCMFVENEAVIKMIIKGRSPTLRHVRCGRF